MSELRELAVLLAHMLTSGQLRLPMGSTLSRIWGCTAVMCTVWTCTEALGSRCGSRVDVPGRILVCDGV